MLSFGTVQPLLWLPCESKAAFSQKHNLEPSYNVDAYDNSGNISCTGSKKKAIKAIAHTSKYARAQSVLANIYTHTHTIASASATLAAARRHHASNAAAQTPLDPRRKKFRSTPLPT